MKSFFIITNTDKDPNSVLTKSIEKYLRAQGCTCQVRLADVKKEGSFHYTDPEMIPEGTECILVLGGDGTLLQASRDVSHLQIPLIGVNLGTLGFLAEVERGSIHSALDKLIRNDFEIEERMMLKGTIYRNSEVIGEDFALNDIVIFRDGPLRVVEFQNYVNGEYLNSYLADGVILATPTGSTGYSLSVGGPLVSPSASMIILSAVAPHTMNTRSIVFSGDDMIEVEIGSGRRREMENGIASFDGDTMISMVTGDRICITRAERTAKILKLNHQSFIEVLRKKMK